MRAAQNQFVEVRFVNRKAAFTEQSDSFRIAIDAENMMADGGEATAGDQSDVAATNDANLHEFTLR